MPPSAVAAVSPLVVTGELPDAEAVRVLKRDMRKPPTWEAKACGGNSDAYPPEIKVGRGCRTSSPLTVAGQLQSIRGHRTGRCGSYDCVVRPEFEVGGGNVRALPITPQQTGVGRRDLNPDIVHEREVAPAYAPGRRHATPWNPTCVAD